MRRVIARSPVSAAAALDGARRRDHRGAGQAGRRPAGAGLLEGLRPATQDAAGLASQAGGQGDATEFTAGRKAAEPRAACSPPGSWKKILTRSGDCSSMTLCSVAASFSLVWMRTGTFVPMACLRSALRRFSGFSSRLQACKGACHGHHEDALTHRVVA